MNKKSILKSLKLALLSLVICWIFNFLYCLLFHSGDIHLSDIITWQSFAFAIIVTFLLKYMGNKNSR